MADDGTGADWFTGTSGVKNPYFGAMMLGCGEVTDTLSSK
jgi:Cu(I)/Ag(I) efflux system membrane fusion protein